MSGLPQWYRRTKKAKPNPADHHLSPNHSVFAEFSETMTTTQWRWHKLNESGTVFCGGHMYQLVGKGIGSGMVEVKKAEHPIGWKPEVKIPKAKEKHHFAAGHAAEQNFVERMTVKQWRQHLLDEDDTIIFKGTVQKLVARSIGFGVVEVSKSFR